MSKIIYRGAPLNANSPKSRLAIISAILLTLLQAAFCIIFLYYIPGSFSVPLVLLVMLWGICSTIAGLWLIKHIQTGTAQPNSDFDAENNALSPHPDQQNTFSPAYLSKIMHEGMVLLRGDSIVYANQSFAYFLGAGEAELIGTSISAYLHKDDTALLEAKNIHPISSLGPTRTTVRLKTNLGDECWAVCSSHPVIWQGEDIRLLFFENISLLKQTMRSIEERELQQRALIERAPLGIALFEPIGQIVMANSLWHSLWSNVVGAKTKTFNILHDPLLHRTDMERAIRDAFNKQPSSIHHLELSAPWGETRWINISFHPILNPLGTLTGIFMIQQDVTEHVRSIRRENEFGEQLANLRTALSKSREYLLNVIDIMPRSIIGFNSSNIVQVWNLEAEQRFDLPRQQVLGLPLNRLEKALGPYKDIIEHNTSYSRNNIPCKLAKCYARTLCHEEVSTYCIGEGENHLKILSITDVTDSVISAANQRLADKLIFLANLAEDFRKQIKQRFPDLNPALQQQTQNFIKRFDELATLGTFSKGTEEIKLATLVDESVSSTLADDAVKPVLQRDYAQHQPVINGNRQALAAAFGRMLNVLLNLTNRSTPEILLSVQKDHAHAVLKICCPKIMLPGANFSAVFDPFEPILPKLARIELMRMDLAQTFMDIHQGHAGMLDFQSAPDIGAVFVCKLPLAEER